MPRTHSLPRNTAHRRTPFVVPPKLLQGLLLRGLLAGVILGPAAAAWAFSDGTTGDVWDVSQGTIVTTNSGTVAVSSPNDLLGARESTVEPGSTIFRDDQSAGFVHFVEWRTPAPVTINAFTLYANDDGAQTGDRGFSEFHLLVRNPSTLLFEQIYSFSPAANPYPDGEVVVRAVVTPVVAQDFRAEFVQAAGTGTPARGPRIREIDAGSPPFGDEDGGFVPPDKAAAKCENAVAKLLAKLLAKTAGCVRKGAKAAIKGKAFDEDACDAAAKAKFYAAGAKLKCPTCIESAVDLHQIATAAVAAAAPAIYCAGSTTFGNQGAFVPPDKVTAKCADGVANSFSKLAGAIFGCHVKAAKKAFARKPFDEEACEQKGQNKYDAAHAKRTGCPPCLDAAVLASTMRSNLDDQNADVYCAF